METWIQRAIFHLILEWSESIERKEMGNKRVGVAI
jgi:hypothetical protein